MSWLEWAERVKQEGFVGGGIYGLDGTEWGAFGQEAGYKVEPQIVKTAQQCMASGPGAGSISIGGKKIIVTNTTDDSCMGKCKSELSFVAVKCAQSVVVGIGGAMSEPRSLRNKLESVASALKGAGY